MNKKNLIIDITDFSNVDEKCTSPTYMYILIFVFTKILKILHQHTFFANIFHQHQYSQIIWQPFTIKTTSIFMNFLFSKLHSVNRFCQAFLHPELSKMRANFGVLNFGCVDCFTNFWNICWCQFYWVWKSTGFSNIEDGEKHKDHFGELHFVELVFGIKECLDLNWWLSKFSAFFYKFFQQHFHTSAS